MITPKCVKTLSIVSAILSGLYGIIYALVVLGQKSILPLIASFDFDEMIIPIISMVISFLPIIANVSVAIWILSKNDGWTKRSCLASLLLVTILNGLGLLLSAPASMIETKMISLTKGAYALATYSVIHTVINNVFALSLAGTVLAIVSVSILTYHCKLYSNAQVNQGGISQ